MKHRAFRHYGIMAAGLLVAVAGIAVLLVVKDVQGVLRVLPYLCVGIGSGLFGQGMGSVISRRKMEQNPEIARQIRIEQKDERNIAVVHRAKAKALDIMLYTFAVLLLALVVIGVSTPVLLLLVFGYVFVIGSEVYYISRYSKEM